MKHPAATHRPAPAAPQSLAPQSLAPYLPAPHASALARWAGPCTAAALALLAGCGGGDPTPPAAAAAPPALRPLAAVQPAVGGEAPAHDGASAPYDVTLLFDWAERTYPDLFPGPQTDRTLPPWRYRAYPTTGNAAGVDGTTVAVLGPAWGTAPVVVGSTSQFACQVLPHRCTGATLAARRAAADQTARTHPSCVASQPFHWQVGDAGGKVAEGQAGTDAPAADAVMNIASATKWLWGAYATEVRQGVLTAEDIGLLNFTSGYTGFEGCLQGQTVAQCQSHRGLLLRNGEFVPAHVGRFFYSGGHMQRHGVVLGVGDDDNAALGARMSQTLGITVAFSQPQLAGGAMTSGNEYGRFLQRMAAGRYRMSSMLGRHAVCTNPATCPTAVSSPVAGPLSWDYSLGHWVETDPATGDGAFSSAGAFGFYPWLDKGKTWWGVLARRSSANDERPARDSAACGAQIRAAWARGNAPVSAAR